MANRNQAGVIFLILLAALVSTLILPQAFASTSTDPPAWVVQGTFGQYTCPGSANGTCPQLYQISGFGGLSCAFASANQLGYPSCNSPLYYGTWRLLFTCTYANPAACSAIPAPPAQGQQVTAYGVLVQPSTAGSTYSGDIYVLSWYPTVTTYSFSGPIASYGDQNIEQWQGTVGGDTVQAYLMFSVPGPVLIRSVSMYLQYSGSDGSQCMWFGVYADNGNGSPAGQPLIASTRNTYCLRPGVTWGPAWQTWNLRGDALFLPGAGTYWLAVLAPQSFGNVYHYAYSSSYDYTYGYATYFFTTPYAQGFPPFFNSNPSWEGNGPYSIYVTASS